MVAGLLSTVLWVVGGSTGCAPTVDDPPEAEWLAGNWHQVGDSCPGACRVVSGYTTISVSDDGMEADVTWTSCSGGWEDEGGFEVVGEQGDRTLQVGELFGDAPASLWGLSADIVLEEVNRCELQLSFPTPSGGVRQKWIRGRVSYMPLPEGCEGRLIPADDEAADCHEFLSER